MIHGLDGLVADKRLRYALLAAGVQAGIVQPATAAQEVLLDLQVAGVDLRGGIAKWRGALETAMGQHCALIDAVEALLPPEGAAPTSPNSGASARPKAQRIQACDIIVRDVGRR